MTKECKQGKVVHFGDVHEMLNHLITLFADGRNIDIRCEKESESQASCNANGQIYLPASVATFKNKRENLLLYAVFLAHEIAHIGHSFFDAHSSWLLMKRNEIIQFASENFDISPYFQSLQRMCYPFPPILFSLVNILEDFRVDGILAKEYPGYAELDHRFYEMDAKNHFKANGAASGEENLHNAVLIYLRLQQDKFEKKYATVIPILDAFVRDVQSAQCDVSFSLLAAFKIFNVIKPRERMETNKNLFAFQGKWATQHTVQNKRISSSLPSKKERKNRFLVDGKDENLPYSSFDLTPPKIVTLVKYNHTGEFELYPSNVIEVPLSLANQTNVLKNHGTSIERRAAYRYLVARLANLDHSGKIFASSFPANEKNEDDSFKDVAVTFLLDSSRSMFLPRPNTADPPFKRAVNFIRTLCEKTDIKSRICCPRDLGNDVEIEECKNFAEPYSPEFKMKAGYVCGIDPAETIKFLRHEMNESHDNRRRQIWVFLTDSTSHIFRRGFSRDRGVIEQHCQGCKKKRCSVEATDFRTTFAGERSKWHANHNPLLTEHPAEEVRLTRVQIDLLPKTVDVLFLPCDGVKTLQQIDFWNALSPHHWAPIGYEYETGYRLVIDTIKNKALFRFRVESDASLDERLK